MAPLFNRMLEHKLLTINDLDDSHDEGRFTGRASTYGGEPDSYGDTIARGAFADTIKKNNGKIVILNGHDPMRPIGTGKLRDTATALYVDVELNMDLQEACDVHSNLLHGVISGLSIGFVTVNSRTRKDGGREILEADLWEVSTVVFPANRNARVINVKGTDCIDADDAEALALALAVTNLRLTSAAAELHLDRPAARAAPMAEPRPVDLHLRHATLYRRVTANLKDTSR